MRSADNIRKTIKNTKIKTNPEVSKAVLNDLLDQMDRAESVHTNAHQPNTWRIIMNNKTTKFATAAVFIAVAILSVNLLDKTASPAWAIEDTIKALEHIYSIKMSGIVSGIDKRPDKQGEFIEADFVLWAKANKDNTETGELRFDIPDIQTTVVTPSGTTYLYKKKENEVSITEYKNFSINPWLGSKFFNSIKKFAENWQISYSKDEETGKESIFATFLHPTESQSFWFQFDSDTKLPVRFKQWVNTNFEGKPQFYAASIEYNPELPGGIFEFVIPDGAKIIKVPQKLPGYFDDPNVGISAEGLTDEDASLMIVEDYLRALIDGDWEYLAQLRPICNAENWELKFKYNDNWSSEVLEIGQPYKEARCNIGPVVPCMIKYSDGKIRNIKLIVKIRNIDGTRSCVIAGTFGGTKDFDR